MTTHVEAEISQLDILIADHKDAIERLEGRKAELLAEPEVSAPVEAPTETLETPVETEPVAEAEVEEPTAEVEVEENPEPTPEEPAETEKPKGKKTK